MYLCSGENKKGSVILLLWGFTTAKSAAFVWMSVAAATQLFIVLARLNTFNRITLRNLERQLV